jgi:single-strand DNA-binding protein
LSGPQTAQASHPRGLCGPPRDALLENRPKRRLACFAGEANSKEITMSYSSINRVVLIGRLTADPELRALPSGTAVCSLRIACNGIRKEGDGEYAEKPNFFSVVVYGAQAESVYRYTRRGRQIAIDGRLEWRDWETQEGHRRQTVEIVASRVQFLDRGRSDGQAEDAPGGGAPEQELEAEALDERELVGVGAGSAIEDDVEF